MSNYPHPLRPYDRNAEYERRCAALKDLEHQVVCLAPALGFATTREIGNTVVGRPGGGRAELDVNGDWLTILDPTRPGELDLRLHCGELPLDFDPIKGTFFGTGATRSAAAVVLIRMMTIMLAQEARWAAQRARRRPL